MKKNRPFRRKGGSVTIGEVAALAGVSPMTVSRVVNQQGNVREDTRERVLQAVQALGYTSNPAASSLAATRGMQIALIYSNPSTAYLSELLVGTLRGSLRGSTQLVIESWDKYDVDAGRARARVLARSVAGVVLPPPLCESRPIVDELLQAGVAVVGIGSARFGERMSRVRIDDFNASRELAEHLIAQGHRRIGYIKGHPNQTASGQRFEGFRAAMAAAGIAVDGSLVEQGFFTYRSGLEAADKLISRPRAPSAIIACNDDMAAAVVSVAHRRHLDVPRDLSVVGFDDSWAATTVWPELTTVRQPIAEMAEAAIDILLEAVRRRDGDGMKVFDQVLKHTLIQRDSVAPPLQPPVAESD